MAHRANPVPETLGATIPAWLPRCGNLPPTRIINAVRFCLALYSASASFLRGTVVGSGTPRWRLGLENGRMRDIALYTISVSTQCVLLVDAARAFRRRFGAENAESERVTGVSRAIGGVLGMWEVRRYAVRTPVGTVYGF